MRVFLFFLLLMIVSAEVYAQVPAASQMQRQEELLKRQEDLTGKIENRGKVHIRHIILSGNTILTREEIYDITKPYIEKWLTLDEIDRIIDEFLMVYANHQKEVTISYALEQDGVLNIKIEDKLPLDK